MKNRRVNDPRVVARDPARERNDARAQTDNREDQLLAGLQVKTLTLRRGAIWTRRFHHYLAYNLR